MKAGTTWMMNSSISPSSRNDAITPLPPIIQIFLPGTARTPFAKELMVVYELDVFWHRGAVRPVREDMALDLRAESYALGPRANLVVRLPPPQDHVDRTEELSHALVSGRPRTI
jgi:hypothetical protein